MSGMPAAKSYSIIRGDDRGGDPGRADAAGDRARPAAYFSYLQFCEPNLAQILDDISLSLIHPPGYRNHNELERI